MTDKTSEQPANQAPPSQASVSAASGENVSAPTSIMNEIQRQPLVQSVLHSILSTSNVEISAATSQQQQIDPTGAARPALNLADAPKGEVEVRGRHSRAFLNGVIKFGCAMCTS